MSGPDLVLTEHGNRGATIRRLLRIALVVFFVAVLLTEPPAENLFLCWLVVGGYLAWTIVIHGVARRAGTVGWQSFGLVIDLSVLAVLTLIADTSADVSWTPYLIINGFFLIPVMAATQLRPAVCAAVVVPTVLIYLVSGLITQNVGEEPTSYVLLRTLALAAVGLGGYLLTRLQRSRVATIASLLDDRTALLTDLVEIERREQLNLAETLHDGALQYVLGARLELDDLAGADPDVLKRVDFALAESVRQLRSATAQLHPAVLEAAGLPAALRDLADLTQARGRLGVTLQSEGWAGGDRTSADALLLSTARELLNNVVKHARASTAAVHLRRDGDVARLSVADDGVGIADVDLAERLAGGHLGLASLRVRIMAAGGELQFSSADPHGTIVEVMVPLTRAD